MLKLLLLSLFALGTLEETQRMPQEEAVRLATQTLAEKLHASAEAVEFDKVVETEWSDSSLGCPQKGMMYAQVMTPGYLITLLAKGKPHNVHVGGGRAVVCRSGARGRKVDDGSKSSAKARLFQEVRKDLARRLEVPATEIELSFMGPKVWPDSSLGCPESGKDYVPGEVKGYLIVLGHRGETFHYHADEERSFLCESESTRPR